jgi:hypothetical protein
MERVMILVRQTFQATFGTGGEIASRMRESGQIFSRVLGANHHWRLLTDLSGGFDTVVLEIEMENLAEWESTRSRMFQDEELRQAIASSAEYFVSGTSQFFTIEAQG